MNISIPELLKTTKELNLLYVEDNKDSRVFTLELLTRFFDRISVAKNGIEGLEKFKKEKFDLILTDINMPKMNGLDMINAIHEIDANILILILSAHNEKNYVDAAYTCGAQYYLSKPLSLTELVETLNMLLIRDPAYVKVAQ